MKIGLWLRALVIMLAVLSVSTGSEGETNMPSSPVATQTDDRSAGGFSYKSATEERSIFSGNITTDGSTLYLSDTYNHTIRKVVISTGKTTILAGKAGVSGFKDGADGTLFNHPQGIITDGTNLYISDSVNCAIRKIVLSSGEVLTFAGTAGVCGSGDGVGPDARFGTPHGITSDGNNLYVVDTRNGTIRKIGISDRVVTTMAAADFKFATGITTDGTNLYVIDNGGRSIRQIDIATGAITTVAGAAGLSASNNDNGSDSQFGAINGITNDGANLYVADTYNGTVRQISISNNAVSTLSGTAQSFGFADGTATEARFNLAAGITTDRTNLYVVNNGNNTIRKIVIATGKVTTLRKTGPTM